MNTCKFFSNIILDFPVVPGIASVDCRSVDFCTYPLNYSMDLSPTFFYGGHIGASALCMVVQHFA